MKTASATMTIPQTYVDFIAVVNEVGVVPGEQTDEQVALIAQKLGIKNQEQISECLKYPLHTYRSVVSTLSFQYEEK